MYLFDFGSDAVVLEVTDIDNFDFDAKSSKVADADAEVFHLL